LTDRDALRRLAEALPPGAPLTVPREWILALLGDGGATDGPDYTVAELAAVFSRSESTVRGWCDGGEFEGAYKLGGKSWRVPRAAVPAFRAKLADVPKVEAGVVSLGAWRAR